MRASRSIVGLLAALGLAACVASPTTERFCLDTAGVEFPCVAIVGRLVEFREEGDPLCSGDGVGEEAFLCVIGGADYYVTARDGAVLEEGLVAGGTDAGGFFVADGLAANQPVALAFQKSGFAPAVYSGETAERDSFFYTGSVRQETVETLQEIVDEYSAAVLGTGSLMTVGSGGGAVVRGRVLRYRDLDGNGIPLFDDVAGATVQVFDGAGNEYDVYYRADDADGEGDVDPLATATNAFNASFAAFGVIATNASAVISRNIGTVTVRVTLDGNTGEETSYVIDGGISEFSPFAPP